MAFEHQDVDLAFKPPIGDLIFEPPIGDLTIEPQKGELSKPGPNEGVKKSPNEQNHLAQRRQDAETKKKTKQ